MVNDLGKYNSQLKSKLILFSEHFLLLFGAS
jgi:hypothetical protein